MNSIQKVAHEVRDFPKVNSQKLREEQLRDIVNLVVTIGVPIAFFVPGVLGLKGRIQMSRGGAITLLTAGSLCTFFFALSILDALKKPKKPCEAID